MNQYDRNLLNRAVKLRLVFPPDNAGGEERIIECPDLLKELRGVVVMDSDRIKHYRYCSGGVGMSSCQHCSIIEVEIDRQLVAMEKKQ